MKTYIAPLFAVLLGFGSITQAADLSRCNDQYLLSINSQAEKEVLYVLRNAMMSKMIFVKSYSKAGPTAYAALTSFSNEKKKDTLLLVQSLQNSGHAAVECNSTLTPQSGFQPAY